MESWDDEDFEPPVVIPAVEVANKWAGEDEEEEVKESWEDEDEEKEEENAPKAVEVSKKSKKKILNEKIAEKERLKGDSRLQEELDDDEDELTPEEKMRRQQESDLKLALETTFSTGDSLGDLPTNKDDLDEFGENLTKKLLQMSKNAEFIQFAENLIRNLCAAMPSHDIRKIKNTLDSLYLEKQKIEKGDKLKKNKGKGKVKLKMDVGDPLSAYVDGYEDFNDFM